MKQRLLPPESPDSGSLGHGGSHGRDGAAIRSHSSLWDSSEAQNTTPKEKGTQSGWHRQVVVLGARGVGQ